MPSFPSSVVVPPVYVDNVDINFAAHMNALWNEIAAIESALGRNPQLLNDSSHASGTVGNLIDTLDAAIVSNAALTATLTHDPITIGGVTGAGNVSVSGGASFSLGNPSIQAYNDGTPVTLTLQYRGGDLHIGSSNCQVTVYGDLSAVNLTATSLAAESVSSNGTVIGNSLGINGDAYIEGNLAPGRIGTTGIVTAAGFALNPAFGTGGQYDLGNGITLRPMGEYNGGGIAYWDGDVTWSQKQVMGSLTVSRNSPSYDASGAVFTVRQAGSRQQAIMSLSGGSNAALVLFDGLSPDLGVQARTAANNAYAPMSASSFITNSSRRFKENIRPLDSSLGTLNELLPVRYEQNQGDSRVMRTTTDQGVEVPMRHDPANHALVTRHGLIAEDLVHVLPEAVFHDGDGYPTGIDYGSLVPLLINSVQELHAEVKNLRSLVNEHIVP